jgi:ribonucleoside-diphosphate reductase alpha chain
VLEKAKQIARRRKSTVSALIENELNRLSKQESGKKLLSEYLKEIPSPKNSYPKNIDFKGAYMDKSKIEAFVEKYALRNKDSIFIELNPKDTHIRIAREFARIEKNKFKNFLSEEEIFNYLDKFKYIVPAGSPLFGIGNNTQIISLSNCFFCEIPYDSYSSILKVDEQFANICKRRGGVGVCLDNLRPAGTKTNNAARTSTGVISFLEM